jgi:hypothetical protein
MGRACGTHGDEEECIQGFCGKARRKVQLGGTRHRWEGNIKMNLRWDEVVWIVLICFMMGTS